MADELVAAFRILGEAKTAGSKKAFQHPKTKRIIVTDDTGAAGRTWRSDVRDAAHAVFPGPPLDCALAVEIKFVRARPSGHYGSGRNAKFVKDSAPAHPMSRPDVDKLSRAILDALKGVVWTDDSRIVRKTAIKAYGEQDVTYVTVWATETQRAADLGLGERMREMLLPV